MTSTQRSTGRGGGLTSVTRLVPAEVELAQPVALSAVQGTLALDLRAVPGLPATPELEPGTTARIEAVGDAEVKLWAARFTQAVLEAAGGDRPVSQLLRWTSAAVYRDLERRVRLLGLNAPAPARRRTIRPQVRSVHVCRPTPGAAEVSVHVRHGERSRALAARLDYQDGRWRCTQLELG